MSDLIYQIAAKESWENAVKAGFYEADSLSAEGFIYCSTAEQVAGVLGILQVKQAWLNNDRSFKEEI